MKHFSLSIQQENHEVSIIEPGEKYGEDNRTYFSEIPLIVIQTAHPKAEFDLIELFSSPEGLSLNDDSLIISKEETQLLVEKLQTLFPASYLNIFASIAKRKNPQI